MTDAEGSSGSRSTGRWEKLDSSASLCRTSLALKNTGYTKKQRRDRGAQPIPQFTTFLYLSLSCVSVCMYVRMCVFVRVSVCMYAFVARVCDTLC